jgi:hypothetical protein
MNIIWIFTLSQGNGVRRHVRKLEGESFFLGGGRGCPLNQSIRIIHDYVGICATPAWLYTRSMYAVVRPNMLVDVVNDDGEWRLSQCWMWRSVSFTQL